MPLPKLKEGWLGYFGPSKTATKATKVEQHTVGVYKADYSSLTAEEIASADAEQLKALFKNSKPVSR